MPGLMCVFDSIDRNGLRYTTNYLSQKFEDEVQIISFDGQDTDCLLASSVDDMLSHLIQRKPQLILTNHLAAIPKLNEAKYSTIVWLTDYSGSSIVKRQENIRFWRQTMGLLKSSKQQIYVISQFMAKQIFDHYRLPCKVLTPYVPAIEEDNSNEIIYYNEIPVHINKLKEICPDQTFEQLSSYEDLKRGKLYIHVAAGLEYGIMEIPIAHSYGIPCLIESSPAAIEYITAGDSTVPLGSSDRQWVSAFKQAMRDRAINSNTVKKLSFRYNHMSEIEDRIKLVLQKRRVKPLSFQEIQEIAKNKFGPPQRMSPEKQLKKQPLKPSSIGNGLPKNDVDHVKHYLTDNGRVYFGCGGLGDAMLTISSCYNDPEAKVIFGANHENVKLLFDVFKIPVLITRNFYPSMLGISLHQHIVNHPHFKGAAHIPDSMNYGEWINNHQKYLNRINRSMPLIDMFGKMINPRNTEGVIGICPRGSDHTNLMKQRYLSQEEFHKLAKHLLSKNKTVFAFGSTNDIDHYGVVPDNNFIWLSSSFGVSHPAPRYPSSFRHMLSCINACDELWSVDTWLKTYGALAGIPTTVILSRRHGATMTPPNDSSDYIFMDKDFWGFNFVDPHSLTA